MSSSPLPSPSSPATRTNLAPSDTRLPIFVIATDSVLQTGVAGQLSTRIDFHVVQDVDAARVAVVVVESIDDQALRIIRGIQRNGVPRVIVIATALDERDVLAGVEAGAGAFLRRADTTAAILADTVRGVAKGDGTLPPDLLGALLARVGNMQRDVLGPRGITMSGLSEREIEILRLLADGLDTNEIATVVCYSERTVKNVIHEVTTRLGVKNRAHAVAYAIRHALI